MKTIIVTALTLLVILPIGCEKNDSSDKFIGGVTFTNIVSGTDNDYLSDSIIVSYDEIIGYDSAQYLFLLSETAGERIRSVRYPVSPTRLAIAVDGDIVYIANFIPGYSSILCEECITIEPYSYDNKYRVKLGYPAPSGLYSDTDPRNDERIISRFKRDTKLMDIEE